MSLMAPKMDTFLGHIKDATHIEVPLEKVRGLPRALTARILLQCCTHTWTLTQGCCRNTMCCFWELPSSLSWLVLHYSWPITVQEPICW